LVSQNKKTACGCKTNGVALYRHVMLFLPFLAYYSYFLLVEREAKKKTDEIFTEMT
jgi:hypothetical protein